MAADQITNADRRNLRDINDGHLSVWVTVDRFNPTTGALLPTPVLKAAHPDRAPATGTPNHAGQWWDRYADAGWIELPHRDGPQRYQITAAGRRVLTDHEKEQ